MFHVILIWMVGWLVLGIAAVGWTMLCGVNRSLG